MSFNIVVEGGTSVRLPTAGKYCDRDIVVTAEGGGIELDVITASALPDTVVDGQIVVITDTTPGTVYIDTDEPASPATGDVWVKLEAEAAVKLELSEESPYLRGGLTAASQWDGSAWVSRDGYLGVDGEWVQIALSLPPIGTALNDMSWEDIAKVSASGKAAEYFSVGDVKEIIIDGTVGVASFAKLSIDVMIIGIYHNPEYEGGKYIHFQIGKIGDVSVALEDGHYPGAGGSTEYFVMNSSATNVGGWKTSGMRTTILGGNYTPASPKAGSMLAALPIDLRMVMKGATKYTDNVGNATNLPDSVTATTDYLWLLAEYEVFGANIGANDTEPNFQKQYEYYASGNSRVRYRHMNITKAGPRFLRSPRTNNTSYFCTCKSDAAASGSTAETTLCIAPAFCV